MLKNKRLKIETLALFGGKCQRCGYGKCTRALQFHHNDPKEKKLWSKDRGGASLTEVTKHPERFLLLCANCHFEEHEAIDTANQVYIQCLYCDKNFQVKPYEITLRRKKFCSRACVQKQRLANAPLTESIKTRFAKYVEKVGECLIWVGHTTNGTPALTVTNPNGKHQPRTARQVSYLIHVGEWPKFTLSPTCGSKNCVAFNHLTEKKPYGHSDGAA